MKEKMFKQILVPLLLVIGMGIAYIIGYIFNDRNKKQECEPIQVYPGDTIVFRYPNIPKNLSYKDADIQFYQPHTDSIVITYKSNCE